MHHTLDLEVLERYDDSLRPDWLVAVLFALLVLLAIVRIFGRERLRLIAGSVIRPRLTRQELSELNEGADVGYLGLWVIAVFSIGLFAYQEFVIRDLPPFPSGPLLTYLSFSGALACYFMGKFLFVRFTAFLMGQDAGTSEYFHTTFMLFALVGVAMLPLVIFRAYVQWVPQLIMAIGALLLGGALVLQWGRGWVIAMAHGAKPIYIVLYFCVLEILPLALVLKVLFAARLGA